MSKIYSYTSLAQPKEGSSHPSPTVSSEYTLHTLPRGAEVGVVLHRIFERIFSEELEPKEIVSEEALFGSLTDWEQPLQDLVQSVLQLPFLRECELVRTEVEFLFSRESDYIKGFIDLLLIWKGKLYFLDWKSNWLGVDDFAYTEEALRNAMDQNDYWLQSSLYKEALQRAFSNIPFGGAFYLFLRGIHSKSQGSIFTDG